MQSPRLSSTGKGSPMCFTASVNIAHNGTTQFMNNRGRGISYWQVVPNIVFLAMHLNTVSSAPM